MLDTAASAMPHVRSGKLRALAISAPKRSPELPDLPTFAEAGLPQYDTNAWYSMHAPAGTPPEIVRRLNAELVAILKDPDVLARFKQLSTDPVGNSPGGIRRLRARRARQVRAHHQGRGNQARLMKLLVLPGDGIGPEITRRRSRFSTLPSRKFELDLQYEKRDIGFAALEEDGTTLPDGVLQRAREVDGVILGPISHLDYPPADKGGVNVSAAFRVKLDLYANVRPARSRAGGPRPADGPGDHARVHRGLLSGPQHVPGHGRVHAGAGVALSVRKITAHACERIARRAFELARKRRSW